MKKKKKGFTLVELLAVVVVLAVLLVITVPKILEVIENAQKQAYKESVELMAHTARLQYQTGEVTGGVAKIPEGGIIYEFAEGEYTTSNTLNFKGDKPFSGKIILTEDKKIIITDLISNDKKWCAKKDANEKHARVGKRNDPGFNCKIEGEEEKIVDEVGCMLATNKDETIYYIDSPSDLYAFSQSVNSGNDYYGKTVKVRNNLDMSTAEGKCVTNFEPIGTKGNEFSGTFDGGGKTISNLTINQPDLDYVGLFGYVLGTSSTDAKIFGVILDEHTVIGGDLYTGGLIGYSKYTTTTEIMLKKVTVEGNCCIGGLYGGRQYGTVNKILVKFAQVTGDEKAENVGSVAGYDSSTNFDRIIVEKAKLSGRSNFTYPIAGNKNIKTYSNDVIVNEVNVVDGFDPKGINDINFYEAVGLDTWIGGEDNTGYYFDYDKNNNIVLKSIEKDPITFNLSQDEDGYYLIKTAKDWKEASSKVTEKYKVDNDLDFSSNKYYMLGSIHNKFSGELDGNDKTISNVIINGNKSNYIGLIGYAQYAIIHSLNFKEIEIHGYDNVGVFGYVNEKNFEPVLQVYSITADGLTVTGNRYVGGLVGYGNYLKIIEILLDNINVNGETDTGGLIGKREYGTLNNVLLKSGTVTGTDITGSVTGYNGSSNFSNMIVEKIEVYGPEGNTHPIAGNNNSIKTYSNNVKLNGVNVTDGFDPALVGNLEYYADVLETLYTGDANNTGYFFDYDPSKNGIYLKKAYSLTFTSPPSDDTEDTNTEGGGTEADNCYITISCSGSGKYRNCYINYYENGVNEAPVLNGFNFNLTQGSSCAAYSLSNTPSGANFYVKKKSSSSCSVTFRASTSADCATTTYKTISF